MQYEFAEYSIAKRIRSISLPRKEIKNELEKYFCSTTIFKIRYDSYDMNYYLNFFGIGQGEFRFRKNIRPYNVT